MKIKSILTVLLLLVVQTMWAQSGQIVNVMLTVRYNGSAAFTIPIVSQGYPAMDMTSEMTSSLVIQKIDVQTTGTVSGVAFTATMYKTENGLQPDDGWRTFPLNDLGNGQWQLDLGPGIDLIDSEMTSPRTFQFYLKAQDGAGNDIYFNNGGEDYKLLFVPGKGDQPVTSKIKSLKLTINHDGEVFTVDFPASGWPEQIIDGQTTSLKILKVEVETDAPMTYVGFCATMYSTSEGWQHNDDEWKWIELANQGGNRWVLDMGEGIELVEEKWLTENKTKTFEFFVQAGDANDNTYYYANGVNEGGYRNNYKVTFSTGEGGGGGDDKGSVSFLDISTATINFKVNDETRGYVFDGDGTRYPSDMPLGDLYSLKIDGYYLTCLFTSEAERDVTLQYKVYEAGGDGQWNGIRPDTDNLLVMWDPDAQENIYELFCLADGLDLDVCSGLEYGKDYVLEIMYQVIAYDNYFFFGRDLETTRFPFHYDNETGIRTIGNGQLTIDNEGETYNLGGQRVGNGYKGIVISKGRKEVRK